MVETNEPVETPEPKQLSLVEALVPALSLILLVALSYYLFGDAGSSGPNQVALVVATMIAVFVARRRGFSLQSLSDAAIGSVGSGMGAIFILFAVGALIGTWALSGTLMAMVYYGMKVLDPNYFYVTAAALCAAVSVGIGSSWTVVGTIGIGLMGIAVNMDLDPAIAAAAIISGAYFGDTTSPLSSSTHLAAGAASADFYDHIRETALTSAIALGAALFVFWFFGQAANEVDSSAKEQAIVGAFHITPWLFLPLLVVIVLALFKLPPFTTIFIGALVGGLMAVILSPERVLVFAAADESVPTALALIKGVWLALASGYTASTGIPALDVLASRGGMSSMLNTIWLVITAFAFGGVIERTGMLDRLVGPIIAAARTTTALVSSLVGAVIVTNVATADQYLAVVLPGRMFKGAFRQRGLAEVVLSRSIGASATPTSALVPWNSCGAYMAATLGVSTFEYLPYAVFNFTSPLLPILAALFGIRMFGRNPEQAVPTNGT
ncbi:Na+/H+ antiporter NhaC [Mesorhizobium microcysteis]|uniref:Na+/H+ antiporter NhaC n=1 Tax=Neoaquamicrobium microcysteis TaxID=2682781 RepID=A0A5D4GML0_9HYPH|nr:Na+/H+ antiporter NhaC family protein [Mesorhizobium microcysteis]TYR29558.1 Na+/H+ antiporter NhaC [Mesorhizobium microcysteis]